MPALAIVLAIAVPVLRTASQFRKRLHDAKNLNGIGVETRIYLGNTGAVASSLDDLLRTRESPADAFQSPFDPDRSNKYDYYFVSFPATHGCTNGPLPPTWIQAFGDPADNENRGANILYLDGHIAFLNQQEFDQEIEKFKKDYAAKCGSPPLIHPPQ